MFSFFPSSLPDVFEIKWTIPTFKTCAQIDLNTGEKFRNVVGYAGHIFFYELNYFSL